jgi:2-methylcitrate dehydratase PrpD
MSATGSLARFVSALTFERLPPAIVTRVKELVLDQLAIQIGVSQKPWLRIAYEYVMACGGRPEATIAGFGDQTTAEQAAFVNGAFGHGFELEDVYAPALSHPGPVIVPAALAVAERAAVTGRDLITAVVAGYEVMGRVGEALAPGYLYRGFHPTSASGAVGAAAAAGRLLKLEERTLVNALAVGGSLLSGLTECYHSGGEVKRYHGGIAAGGGVRAAELAARGLTGPPTILEGRLGIRALSDTFRLDPLEARLGTQFVVSQIWQKRYSCNGMLHGPLDGLERLQTQHGLEAHQVEQVIVGSNQHALQEIGAIHVPTDIFGLQFSVYYAIAIQLVRGRNVAADYTEDTLRDPAIAAMAKRIRLEVDPQVEAWFPKKIGGRVTVLMKDGRRFSELVEDCKGTPAHPLTEAERLAKVRGVAGLVMARDRVERLVATIGDLEHVANVRTISHLLKA